MRKFVKLDVPQVNIHPLRITDGWSVHYNNFWEIDPKTLDSNDDCWFMFTDSLLQLHHQKSSITLDLGWNPNISHKGTYLVLVIKDSNWENPIHEFTSNDNKEVIEYIELTLKQITSSWWK
ncbi:hypothetical protein HOO54_17155 [Bacillus sp. WMMC1349]|uniref:hypothetical protein n=1 Tax=Bacillus sp. WMMC1349 TaxID=2736254 RepID=UPI001553C000|nr:hypothetical protein [Bacillus sp. WMMC1349]NPC93896.1 hypothetical protein [Bacillus sp. WMMC1349]